MLLNEYAQKRQLSFPVYETKEFNKSFISTITFNGKQYRSLASYTRQKDAEQNAAQVALTTLLGIPPDEIKKKDITSSHTVSIKSDTTDVVVSFKSKLNEFAQKKNLELPTY